MKSELQDFFEKNSKKGLTSNLFFVTIGAYLLRKGKTGMKTNRAMMNGMMCTEMCTLLSLSEWLARA